MAATLVSCSDDDDCDSGVRIGGRCVNAPTDAGREESGADPADAGRDGGEGEGEGECAPACDGAAPLCDLDRLECVACLSDGDCVAPTPRCDPAGRTCVRCLEAADCDGAVCLFPAHECVECRDDRDCESVAPRCDPALHACGPCTPGGAECDAIGTCFADGPSAGDDEMAGAAGGSCVPCNQAGDCEAGDACDPWTHSCVIARGNLGWCEPCFADPDCRPGDACVVVEWPVGGGAIVGTVCARDCSDPGPSAEGDTACAGEIGRGAICRATVGRDGGARAACLPATSTCEGFREAAAGAGCATAEDCGAAAIEDGLCIDGEGTCTIQCGSVSDCPQGLDLCEGEPLHCRSA